MLLILKSPASLSLVFSLEHLLGALTSCSTFHRKKKEKKTLKLSTVRTHSAKQFMRQLKIHSGSLNPLWIFKNPLWIWTINDPLILFLIFA